MLFYRKTTNTNLIKRRRRDIIVIHKMERNYFLYCARAKIVR
jgi:hypothetical protein